MARYVPKIGEFEGKGVAYLIDGRLVVQAPLDGDAYQYSIEDLPSDTGYVHSFLRPFYSVVFGRQKPDGTVKPLSSPGTIIYILVEESSRTAPLSTVRCAGAITISASGNGYTLCYFPPLPPGKKPQYGLDHLSAHVDFASGKIEAKEIHLKLRPVGGEYATTNVPTEYVQADDNHFVFEVEFAESVLLDPIGAITSKVKPSWPSDQLKKISERVEKSVIKTIACSLPNETGLLPPGSPLLVRVGVVLNSAIAQNGALNVISEPKHHCHERYVARIHRFMDASKIDARWPPDASVFVEVGSPPEKYPSDYTFTDLKGSTIQDYRNGKPTNP